MLRYLTPSRKRIVSIVFFFVTFVLVITLRTLHLSDARFQYSLPFGLGKVGPDRPNLHSAPTCSSGIDHLRNGDYGLTSEVIYQKRCIRPKIDQNLDRSLLASIAEPLIGQGQAIRLDKSCRGWDEPQCDTVELTVPPPYPGRNYSDILFGVATSSERLRESLFHFDVWLAHSGARMLAVITDEGDHDDEGLNMLAAEFRNHGIDLTPIRPWNKTLGANEQHFTIVRDLLRHATPDTKWAAIIDDDTFFPALYPLAQELEKRDPASEAYMGALSENKDAVDFHGFMAFGGAGAFLSVPLLRKLDPHVESCLAEEDVPQGDGLLKYCIYNKTEARLDFVPGLHQIDMGGDMSGLYESGQLPLSLHHWKTWHQAPVDQMAVVSDFCGGCVLQRWEFGNDTVLANGYSIAVYADGTESIDLDRMEGTWEGPEGYEWSMGPMRARVDKDKKKSYRLVKAEKVGEKNFRQIYIYRAEEKMPEPDKETEELGDMRDVDLRDEVVELWWEW